MTKIIRTASTPTTLGENIAYGLSEVACNPIYTIMLAFLVYFYTDVVGVNAGVVGTIILVSKVLDGISDIIAGNIIDHTHTKAGSARPWNLWLAIPIALSYVVLFTVPNCGTTGKVLYIFISYNLVSTVVYTLMNAAMSALPAFITEHGTSRSLMMSIRLFIGCIVQMILLLFTHQFVAMLGGGQIGWIKLAAILGAIAAATLVYIYCNTNEMAAGDKKVDDDVPLFIAVKSLLQNKYWFLYLLMNFFGVIAQLAVLTVGTYYAKYILNDLNMQTMITLYFYIAVLLSLFITPFLLGRGISKRLLALSGAALLAIGSLAAMAFPSGNGFVISLMVRGFGFGVLSSSTPGMLFETIAYGEWKTGYNITSVNVTANCVGQKIGSGVGTSILGITLALFGYDGLAAAQPTSALRAISFFYIAVPAIMAVLIIICLWLFKLEKDYPRYIEELNLRHAQKEAEGESGHV